MNRNCAIIRSDTGLLMRDIESYEGVSGFVVQLLSNKVGDELKTGTCGALFCISKANAIMAQIILLIFHEHITLNFFCISGGASPAFFSKMITFPSFIQSNESGETE
jgi:hypothetical protein